MNEQILYLECNSGISGDMTVAALLDLGANEDALLKALGSLRLDGFQTKISRVKKAGLDVCDFDVILQEDNHDHDMEYLYPGHTHEIQDFTTSPQNPGSMSSHHHVHRGLLEIQALIHQSDISHGAKNIALRIFSILAEAEAKAHGVPIEQVHFHEVGAVDSIVDVVSVAVCLDNIGIKRVVIPWLGEGYGSVRCQHGIMSVPVPAVVNIVEKEGLALKSIDVEGELVTPTGAAIAAAIRTEDTLPPLYQIEKSGYGAGKRNYSRPSILRAMVIKPSAQYKDTVFKLESNIDDCTGENLGYVMDQLFKAGAKDVHYTPVYMKKNRPAYQLNVICTKEDIENLEMIIFRETTTIGIRRMEMERSVLARKEVTFDSTMGQARMKVCEYSNVKKIYPEYDSVTKLAAALNLSFEEVYHRLIQEAWKGESSPLLP